MKAKENNIAIVKSNNLKVPDTLYTKPVTALPQGIKRGRAYTDYKLVQLCDKLAKQTHDFTRAELLELVKLAGSKQTVQVTCKSGSVYTHIQPSKLTTRFTGWDGSKFGSFHPSNVKSFRILGTWEIPANETQDNGEEEFYYQ